MLRNKLNNKKKKKGFTLIELIVVLAVLAIIALIAVPNFTKVRENSKIKSDERSADLIDKVVTTLVLDGTITTDGTYLFDGTTVTPPAGASNAANASKDAKAIEEIIDKTKVQQSKSTDPDQKFSIILGSLDLESPKVDVQVAKYSSDDTPITTPTR